MAAQSADLVIRTPVAPPSRPPLLGRPTGIGTSAWWIAGDEEPPAGDDDEPASDTSMPGLFCPGPVRDDPALG
ncbi:MAG TPA: hypothetical protein VHW26_03200, partial [Solirubrobacteraceae bacterium]|nr:hypothetical protein [Solirubrobacteraceae bacterium]